MDKSLEFVKKRLEEQGKSWDYEDKSDVATWPSEFAFRQMLKNPEITDLSSKDALIMGYQLTLINGDKIDVEVTIADKDYEDFDFYNAYSEYNDASLSSLFRAINKVYFEVAAFRVYPTNKISGLTDLEGIQKLKITVGDIVVCQKDSDLSFDCENWAPNKMEVFVPAHFELVK